MNAWRIVPAGDSALLLEFPPSIDRGTSGTVIGIADAVRLRCAASVRDVVAGYCSVTVYFDPLATDARWLEDQIRDMADAPPADASSPGPLVDVPVCYDGDLAPDLEDVASAAGLSTSQVVALHTSVTYRVYVVGFIPGFAYMAHVDPRLALPRRTSPRQRVPAGSVAIAAGQTGIYPAETPGGWHLIGRTRVKPFDESRRQPFMFRAGDEVRFHAVTRDEYERSL